MAVNSILGNLHSRSFTTSNSGLMVKNGKKTTQNQNFKRNNTASLSFVLKVVVHKNF